MNGEEAIEVIKAYRDKLTNSASNQLDGDIKAFDRAIKALELESCEDAISRQAALDLIKGFIADATSHGISPRLDPDYVMDGIKALQPVNPQPKTGKWIDSPNGYFTHCSECGLHGDKGIYKHYGWCPKCGAKMIEPQESEGEE